MLLTLIACLVPPAALPIAAPAGLGAPLHRAAPPPAAHQDQDKQLEEDMKVFKGIIKGKEQELEAIGMIDRFLTLYKAGAQRLKEIDEALEFKEGSARDLKSERKDLERRQDDLAETIAYSFKRKRVTEPHMRLWNATVHAFGQMGETGAGFLWKVLKDNRFSKDVQFRALVVKQIGETKDYAQAEPLADLLDFHEEVVAAAAAEALSLFERAPGVVRREIVSKLVVLLESRHNAATDVSDTDAQRIYSTVREPYLRALTNLTGMSFRDPLDWTRWWNENKKNDEAWPNYD